MHFLVLATLVLFGKRSTYLNILVRKTVFQYNTKEPLSKLCKSEMTIGCPWLIGTINVLIIIIKLVVPAVTFKYIILPSTEIL
jgi:hypothetical protein